MRVLLIDPSDRGGIVAYSDLLARALTAAGADVTLLASEALPPADLPYARLARLPVQEWGRPQGSGIAFYGKRASGWARGAAAVRRAIREVGPDLVHWQFGLNRRFDALFLRGLHKELPLVWTAHDVLPPERSARDLDRYRAIYQAVDRVLVHNSLAADAVRALAHVVPAEVRHPAPAVAAVDRSTARDALGLPIGERVVAAVGYVRAYKGYELLADVWELLGEDAPLLVVVGEPWSKVEAAILDRLDASSRTIVRREFVPEPELERVIAAADALLLPYRASSESGLVHLSRALGTPVIGSDAEQLAASIRSTSAGIVVPRDAGAWARAVTSDLPGPPDPPPPLVSVGRAHLRVYDDVLSARGRSGVGRRRRFKLLAYTDAETFAGAERSLEILLSGLRPEIEVVVAGVDRGVVQRLQSSRPGSAALLLPPVRNKFDLGAVWAHVRAVRKARPDVFHANLRIPWSSQYGVLAAALVRGLPIVAVEHAPVAASGGVQARLRRILASRCDRHVAVSNAAARQVEELLGLPSGSVRTIYNGVPDVDVSPRPRRERVTVGTIARLVPEKRIELLLDAITKVPAATLLVVGDGPERARLELARDKRGLGGRVTFTGWVDDVDLWLQRFDVYAVVSEFESFSLTAVQAMLAGVPVVAAAVGGLPEVVGPAGILIPSGDEDALVRALVDLAARPEERDRLGREGRRRALERFAPDTMVQEYEGLYDELTARG
jgi:glycosyltransferase involved in cell wall biosynthesis